MNSPAKTAASLNVVALGWALSAALVVLFVTCLVIALALPGWGASHNWISLFSTAPLTSQSLAADGLIERLPEARERGGRPVGPVARFGARALACNAAPA